MSAGELLIVSVSTGSGHVSAAEALRAAALSRDQWRVVEHVDLLELAPSWVGEACAQGYEMLASRAPWLWRQAYRLTDSAVADYPAWGALAQRILFREFMRLLRSRRWSVCLGTHFMPAQLAAGGAGSPPFVSVITDFTLHRFWVQPQVCRYFVGVEELASEVHVRAPYARIDATGIPISPRFAAAPTRAWSRAALGLQVDRPVVLVSGGGWGYAVEDTVRAVARANIEGLQILAVCGRNEAAVERLRTSAALRDRVRAFGFVHDLETYLAAADLTVTKAGGLTTSEALALSCPLILTRPIPGQEEGNTRVLCTAGAALFAANLDAVTRAVETVLREPGRLAALAANAGAIGRPHAAAHIVDAIHQETVAACLG